MTAPADPGRRLHWLFSEQVWLPAIARKRQWDVVHSLASTAPAWTTARSVITLHDVTFLRVQTFSRATTVGLRMSMVPAARRANVLITGSKAARDEICHELGLDAGRFVVVPHGAGRPRAGGLGEAEARARHALDGRRVVLCVGAKRPHKNRGRHCQSPQHCFPATSSSFSPGTPSRMTQSCAALRTRWASPIG